VIRLCSPSADDTKAIGAEVAALARPGDLVLLAGELGTGKTTFAQGFGAALGVVEPITSPTFTLVRTYEGRLPLVHADVYRLDRLQEVIDLGLAEPLDDGAVALVEWGDVASSTFTPDYLSVGLAHDEVVDDWRWVELRPVGARWASRADLLRRGTLRWSRA
jgi:tRNA threonylcarbamoyladenosine biosynthesis protein TsaE